MTSNNLDKKLGVWGKDKIVGKDKKFHAPDYYCSQCYVDDKLVQAKVFWPCMDPDIKDYPYCKACVDKITIDLIQNVNSRSKNQ